MRNDAHWICTCVAGMKGFSSMFQLLQMLFFGLAAANDLQPHPDSTLSRCKDFLFSVFVFPVGMVRNIVNHNSSVNPCCSIIVFPLSVCCSTLLDYFCLWQRVSLPGHHWWLLPSVDESRYGRVNAFTSTVQHLALMNEQSFSFLSIRLSFLCCLEKYWCSLTCIHGPNTLWWLSPLWVCVTCPGKSWDQQSDGQVVYLWFFIWSTILLFFSWLNRLNFIWETYIQRFGCLQTQYKCKITKLDFSSWTCSAG